MEEPSNNLSDAIASGDELRILKATRDIVAEQMQSSVSGRDIAALSKQMQELTEKIAQLEKQQGTKRKQSALEKARKQVKHGG